MKHFLNCGNCPYLLGYENESNTIIRCGYYHRVVNRDTDLCAYSSRSLIIYVANMIALEWGSFTVKKVCDVLSASSQFSEDEVREVLDNAGAEAINPTGILLRFNK